jgi:hypothetical protein
MQQQHQQMPPPQQQQHFQAPQPTPVPHTGVGVLPPPAMPLDAIMREEEAAARGLLRAMPPVCVRVCKHKVCVFVCACDYVCMDVCMYMYIAASVHGHTGSLIYMHIYILIYIYI